MQRCLSGLRSTTGNRVYVISVPWVQIPFSAPYEYNTNSQWEFVLFFYRRLFRITEKEQRFYIVIQRIPTISDPKSGSTVEIINFTEERKYKYFLFLLKFKTAWRPHAFARGRPISQSRRARKIPCPPALHISEFFNNRFFNRKIPRCLVLKSATKLLENPTAKACAHIYSCFGKTISARSACFSTVSTFSDLFLSDKLSSRKTTFTGFFERNKNSACTNDSLSLRENATGEQSPRMPVSQQTPKTRASRAAKPPRPENIRAISALRFSSL